MAPLVENPPLHWETRDRSRGREDPPEKGTAAHSSICTDKCIYIYRASLEAPLVENPPLQWET